MIGAQISDPDSRRSSSGWIEKLSTPFEVGECLRRPQPLAIVYAMTTILEELSGKKLASATVLFLVALAGFFIAGGVGEQKIRGSGPQDQLVPLEGPSPTSSHMLLFRGCALRRGKLKAKQSLENPVDRSNCPHHVDHLTTEVDKSLQGDSIVYYAKLPLDRSHVVMSRWFQWIGSSFHIDLLTPPDKGRLHATSVIRPNVERIPYCAYKTFFVLHVWPPQVVRILTILVKEVTIFGTLHFRSISHCWIFGAVVVCK